jgi:hypothetical protein
MLDEKHTKTEGTAMYYYIDPHILCYWNEGHNPCW